MAQFVQDNHLDGIDVDYEEMKLMQDKSGAAETWVSKFTQELRGHLPEGQFILTHARTFLSFTIRGVLLLTEGGFCFSWEAVGPWFDPKLCPGGGYLAVHKNVGDLIDWVRKLLSFSIHDVFSICYLFPVQRPVL